jgi:6-pyruvoyltetrahydropterin/6-carboxytetrahydropterin synthase
MLIEFTRRFSMAHRLRDKEHVKCAIPHGHNEYVQVRLSSCEDISLDGKSNMVLPFARLKKRWHYFVDEFLDHSLQLGHEDPLINYFKVQEKERLSQILVTPGDPTTEVLCYVLACKCQAFLRDESLPFKLEELSIEETPTNKVIFNPNQQVNLIPDCSDWWFFRADNSINDFSHS